jgi:hypothetical protein
MIYIEGVQDDTMEASFYASSATVTQEIEIDCNDGHTFSLETGAVSGCAVRFKHEDDVSYTDIEAGSYDLSPFAGTRETFLIEFNPSAANAPQRLRFRVGPLVPVVSYTYVYNDDGDEIYNDDSDLVRTLA